MAVRPAKRLRYVNIGALAGDAAFRPDILRAVPIELVGSGIGSVSQAVIQQELPHILAALGDLTLPIDPVPLRDITAAWRREGGHRIVVVP